MASIVSTGIGSGLDIAGIVQQLVAAEGQPVEARISQQEARAQSKLSAFGSLKSALSDLRDKLDIMRNLDQFLARKAVSSNEDYFSVSAGTDALPASYSLEVAQLAQAQKLTSGAFTDADTVVGTGTLTLTVGTSTADIEITSENSTLAGIRNAINAATDNPGVAATIVNAESIAPQDALIRIDGFDVMSDTNTFTGAVQGVTITALADTGGVTETLTVENDEDTTRQLVADFVESYNALIGVFDSLTDYNSEVDVAAPLVGDATIRGIRDQIRRELSTAVQDLEAPFSVLRDVGVEVQLDGKLQINDDELSTVLADDFVKFGQLFSTTDGFAVRLYDLADGFLKTDGIIDARTKGLETTIESLNDDRTALNERLASLETRLLRQFNALDSLLAQLSQTSNFLAQQLNSLPGVDRPTTN